LFSKVCLDPEISLLKGKYCNTSVIWPKRLQAHTRLK
jgi:hypothetical protein